MGKIVVNGAQLKCSFGTTASTMSVLPDKMTKAGGADAANIQDFKPMVNIKPFGKCTTVSNPSVAACNGKPQACLPVTVAPWVPGSPTVLLKNQPVLNDSSVCMCSYGGVIKVQDPGQGTVDIP